MWPTLQHIEPLHQVHCLRYMHMISQAYRLSGALGRLCALTRDVAPQFHRSRVLCELSSAVLLCLRSCMHAMTPLLACCQVLRTRNSELLPISPFRGLLLDRHGTTPSRIRVEGSSSLLPWSSSKFIAKWHA